ncbi:unnamed protein product [Auanema sp. JU1783]|nr:unnamed protein product [Auanema sp. JU1783]
MEQAPLLENTEDLPAHVTVHFDKLRRKVYIDHVNQVTSWENPNQPPLPPGWTVTHDASGEIMYIELQTLFMTYNRPSLQTT